MTLSRHVITRLVAGVAALMTLCIIGFWALAAMRPPTITTYEDQVAYALHGNNIGYRDIAFGEIWPDRVNLQYGEQAGPVTIAVVVMLQDGREASGWMECRRLSMKCTLSIRELGLQKVPLPEFSKQRTLPWLEWAERTIADLWN